MNRPGTGGSDVRVIGSLGSTTFVLHDSGFDLVKPGVNRAHEVDRLAWVLSASALLHESNITDLRSHRLAGLIGIHGEIAFTGRPVADTAVDVAQHDHAGSTGVGAACAGARRLWVSPNITQCARCAHVRLQQGLSVGHNIHRPSLSSALEGIRPMVLSDLPAHC